MVQPGAPDRHRPFHAIGIWFKLQRHFLETDRAAQTSGAGVALWLFLTAYAQRSGDTDALSMAAVERVCRAARSDVALVEELVDADYLRRIDERRIRIVTAPDGRFWTKVDCGVLWNGNLAREPGEGLLICAAIDRCATLSRSRGHLSTLEVEHLCAETGQSSETVLRLIEARTWRQRTNGITVVGFADDQIGTRELIALRGRSRRRVASPAVERERRKARERQTRHRFRTGNPLYPPGPDPDHPEAPF